MLTAKDIRGVSAMLITPCKEGGDHWSATDSVDLDETATMIEKLIQAGIGSLAACGTSGECAALLWEEKLGFIDTIAQVNRGRVPLFAGATALGTKEVVRQMKALKQVGADAAFVGLPLWQGPTLENSVRFLADLGEAVPDMPIMVYANSGVFKSTFPTEFWEGVARRAPTVITCKVAYDIDHLEEDVRVAGHQIAFLPRDRVACDAYAMVGHHITSMWTTSATAGPELLVALMEAIQQGDEQRIQAVRSDLESLPAGIPAGQFAQLPAYNAQIAKTMTNAAGWVKAGPFRAPYYDLPDDWRAASEASGKAWAELRKKYMKATV